MEGYLGPMLPSMEAGLALYRNVLSTCGGSIALTFPSGVTIILLCHLFYLQSEVVPSQRGTVSAGHADRALRDSAARHVSLLGEHLMQKGKSHRHVFSINHRNLLLTVSHFLRRHSQVWG